MSGSIKILLWCAISAAASLLAAAPAQPLEKKSPAALSCQSLSQKFRQSQMEVSYHLQYNNRGDAPLTIGIYCPSCGDFHSNKTSSMLADGQDLSCIGYLVTPNTVLAPEVMLNPACRRISVKNGTHSVNARISAYYPDYGAVELKLDKVIPGTRPIEFTSSAAGPYQAYSKIMEADHWSETLKGFSPTVEQYRGDLDRRSWLVPGNSLIVDKAGNAVAALFNNNECLPNAMWNLPWTKWRRISASDMLKQEILLQKRLIRSVLPITIYWQEKNLSRREKLNNQSTVPPLHYWGVMLPAGEFLVPLLLTPQDSSLIRQITVRQRGKEYPVKVKNIMKNFGGVLLQLPKDLTVPPVAAGYAALARELGGEIRSVEVTPWEGYVEIKVQRDIVGGTSAGFQKTTDLINIKRSSGIKPQLMFALDGSLLGVELGVRAFFHHNIKPLINAADLSLILQNPKNLMTLQQISNRPDAVGFLGVEYQVMDRNLARSRRVAHLTNNGEEGLLISLVYPGSPAARMGLKANDILLKLLLNNAGAPIVLNRKNYNVSTEAFPWEILDKVPEHLFGEIPEPWPGVKTPLNSRLTTIGIGQQIKLIVIQNGRLKTLPFTIEAAPEYFDITPAYENPALGIAVKNITFEVRNYLRMKPDTPGIIVSDVTPGTPAASSGLRPYELITAVNDEKVYNINDFKKLLADRTEVNLTIRRLAASRVVTVKLAPAAKQ